MKGVGSLKMPGTQNKSHYTPPPPFVLATNYEFRSYFSILSNAFSRVGSQLSDVTFL